MNRRVSYGALGALVVAVLVVGYARGPSMDAREAAETIDSFKVAYAPVNDAEREIVAARYLQQFSPGELMRAVNDMFPSCHIQGHPVGRAVYAREQNMAQSLSLCTTSCSDACFHGVMSALFKTESDNFGGMTDDMQQDAFIQFVADRSHDLCDQPEVRGVMMPAYCVHGLGHVFTYAGAYNIDRALGLCRSLENAAQARLCSGGAYMEYMVDRAHDAELDQRNFYPCENTAYMSEHCFRYKGMHLIKAWGSAQAAFGACRTLSFEEKVYCIRGVAFWAWNRSPLTANGALDPLCDPLSEPNEHAACIYGAVNFVAVNSEQSDSVCEPLATEYRALCREQVKLLLDFTLHDTELPPAPAPIDATVLI